MTCNKLKLLLCLALWLIDGGQATAGPLRIIEGITEYQVLPHTELLTKDADGQTKYVPFSDQSAFHFRSDLQWLRFSIENPTNAPLEMMLTNEFHMHVMLAVSEPGVGAIAYAGCQYNALAFHPSLFPTIKLRLPPGVSTHVIGFNPDGHPAFPVLLLRTPTAYFTHFERELAFLLGVFIPFIVLMLFSLSSLSGRSYREKARYLFLYAGLWMLPFSYSGLPFLLGPQIGRVITATWMVWFSLILLSFDVTSGERLRFNKSRIPTMIGRAFVLQLIMAPLVYLYYPLVAAMTNLAFMIVINPLMYYGMSKLKQLWNLEDPTSIYTFGPVTGCAFMLVAAVAGLFPYHPFMLYALDLGAFTQVFVIILGLSRKGVNDRIERSRLEHSLELGRSVQNLLLPTTMSGEHEEFNYQFYFKPYRGEMSGDWINQWKNQNREQVFVIGDVVGKGPQAGLAVASISTIIERYKAVPSPVMQCLDEINTILYRLFFGTTNTTISAIRVDVDHRVTVYNAGGSGWFHYNAANGRIDRHALCSSLIGMNQTCQVNEVHLQVLPGDILYTFTDGVCATSRESRRLCQQVKRYAADGELPAFLEHLLSQQDKTTAIEDDRAMVVIYFKESNKNKLSMVG